MPGKWRTRLDFFLAMVPGSETLPEGWAIPTTRKLKSDATTIVHPDDGREFQVKETYVPTHMGSIALVERLGVSATTHRVVRVFCCEPSPEGEEVSKGGAPSLVSGHESQMPSGQSAS